MNGLKRRLTAFCLCFVFICGLLPAQTGPTVKIEPYTKDEFPQWAKDLRRYEIVSLGSLPFVMLLSTLGYGLYRYFDHGMDASYFPNPFSKGSGAGSLTQQEQMGLLFSSLGISAAIGLADFAIIKVKRSRREKDSASASGNFTVTPLSPGLPSVPSGAEEQAGDFPAEQGTVPVPGSAETGSPGAEEMTEPDASGQPDTAENND